MSTPVALSPDEARRLVLTAQGLIGSPYPLTPATVARASQPRRVRSVRAVLEHLGAVQLDTISVLARSHELVQYARLGAVGRAAIDEAYWGDGTGSVATSFEYWSHAASILPVELWPWFAFRRRWYQARGERWHSVPHSALDAIRRRLLEDGPLTTRDIGGAKAGGEWWDWSESKVAIEWLLDIGEVVCTRRVGWRRVYDLAERALPERVLGPEPDDDECIRHLTLLGARAVGVGTVGDILDVHRLSGRYTSRAHLREVFDDLVADGQLVEVSVPGWRGPVYADMALLSSGPASGRHRTTMLSAFDSLIWHRGRTERVFDFEHLFEPYVPAARRQHGYFTMPVLHGGRLVSRVDPKRVGTTLEARAAIFETSEGTGAPHGRVSTTAVEGTALALTEAARWVGCDTVRLVDVRPASTTPMLAAALRAARA